MAPGTLETPRPLDGNAILYTVSGIYADWNALKRFVIEGRSAGETRVG